MQQHPEAAGEAFWRFSLALYARPGVAAALLALQDRAGRDVNLMLFALWLGLARGRRLGAAELQAAEAAIAPLNGQAVLPLRALRRRLRGSGDAGLAGFRGPVAAAELAAERRVQWRLAAFVPTAGGAPVTDRIAAAEANLARHLDGEAGSPEARLIVSAAAALARAV